MTMTGLANEASTALLDVNLLSRQTHIHCSDYPISLTLFPRFQLGFHHLRLHSIRLEVYYTLHVLHQLSQPFWSLLQEGLCQSS